MRTTVSIDDELYAKAMALADPDMEKTEIWREAMKTFVRVQSAKRLAALAGSLPQMSDIPRRRAQFELTP
jgi:Arc/MetJ family transcription regulator